MSTKPSNGFKEAIKAYLDKRAAEDILFAETYKKKNKNLDECCNYVMKCAKDGGAAGYSDEEVFGWAVHYYDEDDIKNIKPTPGKVIINKSVELSEEDKASAKETAMQQLIDEERKNLKSTTKVKLSAEDLAEVKEKAKEAAIAEAKEKLLSKKKPKTVAKTSADVGVAQEEKEFTLFGHETED